MIYLCFDLGLSHTGVAISQEGVLVTPLDTIRSKTTFELIKKLSKEIKTHRPDIVVIGQPLHGPINTLALNIKVKLSKIFPQQKIVLFPEDLSSQEASLKLIQSSATKNKRQKLKHSASATLILEDYLNSSPPSQSSTNQSI